jgi:3-deoxy-D-manno-octulosonate 8-phosphate phosphatase (KDO 8-P phosphatase)
VKLLSLDVDGVLTDGGLYYTESGEELKKFNIKDGMGLKLLMDAGVEVAIISANTSKATLFRARKLGIARVHIGVEDKLSVLNAICGELGLTLADVAHMGDDLNDLPIFEAVGCRLTVADAATDNLHAAHYVTAKDGGQGAVREVCDLIREARKVSGAIA